MGTVRVQDQLGGWGCPILSSRSLRPVLQPPGPLTPQPRLWSLTFRDTPWCLHWATEPVWWQECGPSQGDVPKED